GPPGCREGARRHRHDPVGEKMPRASPADENLERIGGEAGCGHGEEEEGEPACEQQESFAQGLAGSPGRKIGDRRTDAAGDQVPDGVARPGKRAKERHGGAALGLEPIRDRLVDPEHGQELWRTDGTVSGTRMVIDATPGRESTSFSNLHVAGGKVWFSSWRGGAWVSNGTPGGTKKISDTLVLEEAVNHPTRSDVALLVAAPRGTENSELYKSSGTATPPSLVGGTEIYPGVEASYPHHFVELDGYQYFIGYTAVGYRLMRTNGSTTEVVNELNQPTNFGYWTKPLRINDQIVIIDIFGVVWTWDNLSFNLEESWNFPSEAFEADDAVYATVVQSGENQLYRFDADGVVNLSTEVGESINIRTGRTVVSGGVELFFFTTTDSDTETSLWVIRQRGEIPEKLTTFPYFSYDFTVNGIEVAANNSRVYLSA
ncbi:MAG: hypothetical protein EBU84_20140, partial [Actinobacteria bacterium]|nr:hypothetical protein [Actinomycetota bacterium]